MVQRGTATGKPNEKQRAKWGARIPYHLLTAAETVKRDEEADENGGVLVLHGGPWNGNVYFGDDYEREPSSSSRKIGYSTSGEIRVGVFYAKETVYRWVQPSPQPEPELAEPWWNSDPLYCACGERLLLPGRESCERCRLGHPTTSVWASVSLSPDAPEGEAVLEMDSAEIDQVELLSVMSVIPTVADIPELLPSADEVAAFVWRCLAPHYDR